MAPVPTIKGVLKRTSAYYSHEPGFEYEFIEVGDARVDRVFVPTYLSSFLTESLGKEIEISLYKHGRRNVLCAMRRPDGVVERAPDRSIAVSGMIAARLLPGLLAGFIAGFLAAVLGVVVSGSGGGAALSVPAGILAYGWYVIAQPLSIKSGMVTARAAIR